MKKKTLKIINTRANKKSQKQTKNKSPFYERQVKKRKEVFKIDSKMEKKKKTQEK